MANTFTPAPVYLQFPVFTSGTMPGVDAGGAGAAAAPATAGYNTFGAPPATTAAKTDAVALRGGTSAAPTRRHFGAFNFARLLAAVHIVHFHMDRGLSAWSCTPIRRRCHSRSARIMTSGRALAARCICARRLVASAESVGTAGAGPSTPSARHGYRSSSCSPASFSPKAGYKRPPRPPRYRFSASSGSGWCEPPPSAWPADRHAIIHRQAGKGVYFREEGRGAHVELVYVDVIGPGLPALLSADLPDGRLALADVAPDTGLVRQAVVFRTGTGHTYTHPHSCPLHCPAAPAGRLAAAWAPPMDSNPGR